jgi:hypothetical protein
MALGGVSALRFVLSRCGSIPFGEASMSETREKENVGNGDGQVVSQRPSSVTELQDFKNVTNNLVQDALTVWADLWAELEGRVEPSGAAHKANNRFEPSCGWTEFLEKMWVLKHHLDFVKRLSQQ